MTSGRKQTGYVTQDNPKGTILSWRRDGLCSRLINVISGAVLAQNFDLEFIFGWSFNSEVDSNGRSTLIPVGDVPADASEVLSDEFCNNHFRWDADIVFPTGLKAPAIRSNKALMLRSDAQFKREWAQGRRYWTSTFDDSVSVVPDYFSKARNLVSNGFFSDEIQQIVDSVNETADLQNVFGLHVRSGDVVYGAERQLHGRPHEKSITLAEADSVCGKLASEGRRVIVVGATGRDLDYLCDKYENVVSAGCLGFTVISTPAAVIRDAAILSRCQVVIHAGTSAVPLLAEYLGTPEL